MRSEILEPNFYAFRVTGDTKYLNRTASVIDSFNNHLAVTNEFAGLNNVNNVSSSMIDDTQSFWFAEVLKYLYVFPPFCAEDARVSCWCRYLTFDDPSNFSLDNCEQLFNGSGKFMLISVLKGS